MLAIHVFSIIQKSMLDNYSSSFFALDHKYEVATLEEITNIVETPEK
jgi:hypothetical protein